MLRAGPLEALLTGLLAKNPEDRLSASKVRIWLRWLVDLAHSAPSSEVLPTQRPGGTIPLPSATRSPLEAPASEAARDHFRTTAALPAMSPTVEFTWANAMRSVGMHPLFLSIGAHHARGLPYCRLSF